MGNMCGGGDGRPRLQAYINDAGGDLPDPKAADPLNANQWKAFPEVDVAAVADAGDDAQELARWAAEVLRLDETSIPLRITTPEAIAATAKVFSKFGKVRTFDFEELFLTVKQWDQLETSVNQPELKMTLYKPAGACHGIKFATQSEFEGGVIAELEPGGHGWSAGLGPGMTVVAVGDTDVSSEKEALEALDAEGPLELKVLEKSELRLVGVKVGELEPTLQLLRENLERSNGTLRCTHIADIAVGDPESALAALKKEGGDVEAVRVTIIPGLTSRLETPVLELFSIREHLAAEEAKKQVRDFVAKRDAAAHWEPLEERNYELAQQLNIRARALPSGKEEKVAGTVVKVHAEGLTFKFDDDTVEELQFESDGLSSLEYEALPGVSEDKYEGLAKNAAALSLSKWMLRAEELGRRVREEVVVTREIYEGLTIYEEKDPSLPRGMYIMKINEDKVPISTGLRPGLRVFEIDGKEIKTHSDLKGSFIVSGGNVALRVGASVLQKKLRFQAAFERISEAAQKVPLPMSPAQSPAMSAKE